MLKDVEVSSDVAKVRDHPAGDDIIFNEGAHRAQRSKDLDDEAP